MIDKALQSLVPNCEWVLDGGDIQWSVDGSGHAIPTNFVWLDTRPMPTKQQIDDAVAEQQTLLSLTEYQRLRAPEYPPLADLADALYHQANGDNSKMEAYLSACEAVKQKYPKGTE